MTVEEFQTEAQRLTPQLRQKALYYVGDIASAQDIVQDVLLHLWQLLNELHVPMDGLALIMVRNECLMHLRSHRKSVEIEGHDIAEHSTDNTMADMVLSLLKELPPMQQTVMRLRHIDEMPIRDIAKLLNKEETAIRKTLSRGRKTLKGFILEKMKEINI